MDQAMSLQLNNVAHELQNISTSIQRVQMPTASIVQTVPTAQHATATPNFTTPFTSAVSTNTVNEMPTTPDLPEETMETETIDIPDLNDATENIDIADLNDATEKIDIPDLSEATENIDIPDLSEATENIDIPDLSEATENIDIPNLDEVTENIDIPEVPAAQEKEFTPTFTVVEKTLLKKLLF